MTNRHHGILRAAIGWPAVFFRGRAEVEEAAEQWAAG